MWCGAGAGVFMARAAGQGAGGGGPGLCHRRPPGLPGHRHHTLPPGRAVTGTSHLVRARLDTSWSQYTRVHVL